jgi:hypothetical protein
VTDQLEDIFAAARRDALAEVRPPGTAAARRTVRRRRAATAVAAGTALLSIVTAVAVAGTQRDDDQPAGRPAAAAAVLSSLGEDAKAMAGVDGASGPSAVFRLAGAAAPVARLTTVGGGVFAVRLACAGEGTVTVRFDFGPVARAQCSDPPSSAYLTVTVPESRSQVQVWAAPDRMAAGHAAVALQMKLSDTDRIRLEGLVRDRLPGTGGRSAASHLPGAYWLPDATVEPGRYRVWFDCVGTGTVELTVRPRGSNAPPARATLGCGGQVVSGSVTVEVPAAGRRDLDVVVSPDRAAAGLTFAGIRVVRS